MEHIKKYMFLILSINGLSLKAAGPGSEVFETGPASDVVLPSGMDPEVAKVLQGAAAQVQTAQEQVEALRQEVSDLSKSLKDQKVLSRTLEEEQEELFNENSIKDAQIAELRKRLSGRQNAKDDEALVKLTEENAYLVKTNEDLKRHMALVTEELRHANTRESFLAEEMVAEEMVAEEMVADQNADLIKANEVLMQQVALLTEELNVYARQSSLTGEAKAVAQSLGMGTGQESVVHGQLKDLQQEISFLQEGIDQKNHECQKLQEEIEKLRKNLIDTKMTSQQMPWTISFETQEELEDFKASADAHRKTMKTIEAKKAVRKAEIAAQKEKYAQEEALVRELIDASFPDELLVAEEIPQAGSASSGAAAAAATQSEQPSARTSVTDMVYNLFGRKGPG